MPLVILCGMPGSGKTTKAVKIKEYLEKENKVVYIVSESEELIKAGFEKNVFFMDSQKEKHIRGVLKSEVMRLMNKDNVVILDSGTYIKGYRYELYCASKSCKNTQCTVYSICNIQAAWERNTNVDVPYTREVFDALVSRFEEPNSQNRWDSPLVVWNEEDGDEESLRSIHTALFDRAPPPPNMSTQNAPVSSTTFLQEVDSVTRRVCERAAAGLMGGEGLPCSPPPTPAQLARLRRQFLTYTKLQLSSTHPDTIAKLFVQYLVTSLQ